MEASNFVGVRDLTLSVRINRRLIRKKVKGVVCVSSDNICGLDLMTDGVTRYDVENVAGCENGFWSNHNPRILEEVGSCNTVPRILAHDFRSQDWVSM